MMDRTKGLAIVAFALLLASGPVAEAAFVTPNNALSTSYWAHDGVDTLNLINSSGLSANSPAGTHDNHLTAATMWIAGDGDGGLGGPTGGFPSPPPPVASQEVVFDLGRTHDLTGAYVWNQNQVHPAAPLLYQSRGTKDFDVYVSSDTDPLTATWTPIGSKTLAVAGGTPAEPAQWVPFAASGARLVKFDIQTAHSGAASEWVGLSEVRFEGDATNPGEPLLSVDFGHSSILAAAPTQAGFSPFLETDSPSKTFGAYTVGVSGHQTGLIGGFVTRGALSDSGAFTNAALYDDSIFSNVDGGGPLSFVIDGLVANTPYEIKWYVYDRFDAPQGGITTNTIAATAGSNTAGDTVTAVWDSTVAPTSNDQYAFTGTWSSTDTSLEIDISFVSTTGVDSGNDSYVRASGFEIFQTTPPPPPPVALLLRDDFDSNTPNSYDVNADIARQTGSLAPTPYLQGGGPTSYTHQLQNVFAPDQLLLADWGTVAPDFNFNGANSEGGLLISFDVDPQPGVFPGRDPLDWGAISVGSSQADALTFPQDLTVGFRGNGRMFAFDGPTLLTDLANEPIYTGSPGPGMKHIEIRISGVGDNNPFDGVGDTLIEVFSDVNGFTAPVYSFTKIGGYADNYVSLHGINIAADFDNFEIFQISQPGEIPEPSTFALWCLGVLGLRWYRRRRPCQGQ